jgi:regulator of protease activity HflC (stomatin/prohibitin superfamily)
MSKKVKSLLIIVGIIVVVLIALSNRMFFILDPVEKAVIFRPYSSGLDKDHVYGEGFHIVAPWNKMIKYSIKEQQREETMDVLDKNGLSITMDMTVRFMPASNNIGFLYEKFQQDYIDLLVVPEVRSTVRQVAGRYTAEEIYSTKRAEVENAIKEETRIVLEANYVNMKALLIRSIKLPDQIKNAIESKLKQEQEAAAMKYRLDKEQQEAERKRIEAEGISNYNNIINKSLTDKILTQRGIEATIKLSESPNTKVIVIGGEEGLPLILGNN